MFMLCYNVHIKNNKVAMKNIFTKITSLFMLDYIIASS